MNWYNFDGGWLNKEESEQLEKEYQNLNKSEDVLIPTILEKLKLKYYQCKDSSEFLQYFKELVFQKNK